MSTRCNILIMEEGSKQVSQYYHHCDGYPEGVGRELAAMALVTQVKTPHKYNWQLGCIFNQEMLSWMFRNLLSNTDYEYEGRFAEVKYCKLHGDIEYLYVVYISPQGISVEYVPMDYTDEELFRNLESEDRGIFKNLEVNI